MRHRMPLLLVAVLLLPPACTTAAPRPAPERALGQPTAAALARSAGVALTTPPYAEVHAEWKERLPQPYVYREHRGAPQDFGDTMRLLLEDARREGVEPGGAPFGLFDDRAPSRACLPVAGPVSGSALPYDVLPSAMVAYAVVTGPYPEVPSCRPGIEGWMATRGWTPRGPVREIYLVNPAEVDDYSALVTEVQIAWAFTR